MRKASLKIHSENLLPIIKRWLYSDREIFLRELVANACDALKKLKLLGAQNSQEAIHIRVDKGAKCISVADSGLGMTEDEVERYICQLAFSGAEDFLAKYQGDAKDQIIGHFGLGFYSSYMVANKVEIDTLSYQEGAKAVHWICDGSHDYEIELGTKSNVGTTVTLHVGAEFEEYLELPRLREILVKYCQYLPFPIYLQEEQINKVEPLWCKSQASCSEAEYLEFYSRQYPKDPPPLFWIHLNVDYPFNLKGILYFPKLRKEADFKASHIGLFCNRVFVSDNCKDLIPEYLTVLRGALDAPDLPLNVSRSYLQMDRHVKQLSAHIAKKVADHLVNLAKEDREAFLKAWPDIEIIVKLGALEDEKFYDRVKDILVWACTDGTYRTAAEYVEAFGQTTKDTIYYCLGDEDTAFVKVFKEKGVPVVFVRTAIDTHLMSFLEGKAEKDFSFVRVDGKVADFLIDSSREQTLLDAQGRTAASQLADFAKAQLNVDGVEVEVKSLAADSLASFVVFNEQERRFRDYMRATNPDVAKDAGVFDSKRTLVLNSNNPIVQSLQRVSDKDPKLAQVLLRQLYTSALLAQKELSSTELSSFVEDSQKLCEALIKAY